MISADAIPGEIGIDELVEQVAKLAARYLKVRDDFSVDFDDSKSLRRLLVENPIRAFVRAGNRRGVFFRFRRGSLSHHLRSRDADSFESSFARSWTGVLRNISADQVSGDATADIVCRVARAGDRPILFLPALRHLHLELGPTPVQIDGEAYEALIAKIAINVVRKPGEETTSCQKYCVVGLETTQVFQGAASGSN